MHLLFAPVTMCVASCHSESSLIMSHLRDSIPDQPFYSSHPVILFSYPILILYISLVTIWRFSYLLSLFSKPEHKLHENRGLIDPVIKKQTISHKEIPNRNFSVIKTKEKEFIHISRQWKDYNLSDTNTTVTLWMKYIKGIIISREMTRVPFKIYFFFAHCCEEKKWNIIGIANALRNSGILSQF